MPEQLTEADEKWLADVFMPRLVVAECIKAKFQMSGKQIDCFVTTKPRPHLSRGFYFLRGFSPYANSDFVCRFLTRRNKTTEPIPPKSSTR